MVEPMTTEDKKWRAEQDARTLKDAEIIRADEERLTAAMAILDEELSGIVKAQHAAEARYPYLKHQG